MKKKYRKTPYNLLSLALLSFVLLSACSEETSTHSTPTISNEESQAEDEVLNPDEYTPENSIPTKSETPDRGDGLEPPGIAAPGLERDPAELTVDDIVPVCHNQKPQYIDLTDNYAQTYAHTADGLSFSGWLQFACNHEHESLGNERIFAILLKQPTTLKITLKSESPENSQIALYIRTTCEDPYSQQACAFVTGRGDTAQITEKLPAGIHYIFVDDFGPDDDTQQFSLSIQNVDMKQIS